MYLLRRGIDNLVSFIVTGSASVSWLSMMDGEVFLAGLCFEKRNLLAELPGDLLEDRRN